MVLVRQFAVASVVHIVEGHHFNGDLFADLAIALLEYGELVHVWSREKGLIVLQREIDEK